MKEELQLLMTPSKWTKCVVGGCRERVIVSALSEARLCAGHRARWATSAEKARFDAIPEAPWEQWSRHFTAFNDFVRRISAEETVMKGQERFIQAGRIEVELVPEAEVPARKLIHTLREDGSTKCGEPSTAERGVANCPRCLSHST